mmetsp:Transcript_14227/g.32289  ORF Transcript_14227/g.32289 Transcript_14227/m.32289 type:complete len:815 (+) Transcript_14227:73-2517(+)
MPGEESRQMLHPEGDDHNLDREEPKFCGSHIDKVWLVPFVLVYISFSYFGAKGINEFNIYKAGEERARQICKPVEGLRVECEKGLQADAAEAASTLQNDQLRSLHDQGVVWSQIRGDVTDVCDRVHNASGACVALAVKPNASEGCAALSLDLKRRCAELLGTADMGGERMRAVSADYSNDTLANFLKLLNGSSSAVCPVTHRLAGDCASLNQSVADALSEVLSSVQRMAPGLVPVEVVEAAIHEVRAAVLQQVGVMCGNVATSLGEHCGDLFNEARWQLVLESVVTPMHTLQGLLPAAMTRLNATAVACQDTDWSEVQSECEHERLSEMYLVHSLTETCETPVLQTPGQQCGMFKDNSGILLTALNTTQGGLDNLGSMSGRVQEGCGAIAELHSKCMSFANPGAALTQGATGLWQRRATEILMLELWLILACTLTTIVMLHVIKHHTACVVTVSIVLNLVGLAGLIVLNLSILNFAGALMFGIILALKALWFWCIRNRFVQAIRLIHCAVEALGSTLGVLVWLFGLLITLVQAGVLVHAGGCYYHLTGNNAPPMVAELNETSPALLPAMIVFAMVWIVEVASNTLHIAVCCSLGGSCGVRTPARTMPRAIAFALIGGIGSNCFGSFLVAALKGLQHLLEKSEKTDNPVVKAILKAVCCLLEVVLKMYNSYAFVFVGLKGVSYCTAAKRTFDAMLKDGVTAIAADEALHDVVHIAKLVGFYVASLVAFWLGYEMDIIGFYNRSWQEVIVGPLLCLALACLTSYALTLTMGRLIEASVCTLFIVYGHETYGQCMKQSQQALWEKLSGVTNKDEDGP